MKNDAPDCSLVHLKPKINVQYLLSGLLSSMNYTVQTGKKKRKECNWNVLLKTSSLFSSSAHRFWSSHCSQYIPHGMGWARAGHYWTSRAGGWTAIAVSLGIHFGRRVFWRTLFVNFTIFMSSSRPHAFRTFYTKAIARLGLWHSPPKSCRHRTYEEPFSFLGGHICHWRKKKH